METKLLNKAIVEVMKAVKNIDKTMNVGTGRGQYKGVSDKSVKETIQPLLIEHGLTIVPIDIEERTEIDSWDEADKYGTKRKRSVFTSVKVKYRLSHESGESMEVMGYGHGVDSQDKGAGKATTYALKYALLYTFMIPTGSIDDTDAHHSDDVGGGDNSNEYNF